MEELPLKHNEFVPDASSVAHVKEQNVKFTSENILVQPSQVHGLGVFATKNFQPEETIEIFPIIPLSFRTNYQGDARVLDYSAVKFCECEECKKHGYVIFMRLGYGGLYNHQDTNNAKLFIDYNQFYGKCVAEKNISQGEEIFINYGPHYVFREGKHSVRE